MFKQIPHTEYLGGAISQPFLQETEFEVGLSDKKRQGEKYIAYNKIPFISYEYHKVDKKKKLPMNKDKLREEEVLLSFLELKKAYSVFIPIDTYPMRYVGNHITDYYNEHIRNDTMNSRGVSLNTLWNNSESRKKLYEDAYSLKKQNVYLRGEYNHKTAERDIFSKLTDQDLKGALQNSVFSNNQFKPFTAKVIYSYFDNKVGINNILDFSSGWGGRMVGAMSLGKNYIGIDPNIDIRQSYEQILNKLKDYTDSNVKMICNYSENVDYSKLNYDFVLTSPPYIEPDGKQTEKYANMKDYDQISFYNDFLFPTIYRIILNLPNGKYFCINTNVDNMDTIKKYLLGNENEKIPYKTKERAGAKKRRAEEKERYMEYVYCYKRSEGLIKTMKQRMKIKISNTPNSGKALKPIIEINGTEKYDDPTSAIRQLQKGRRESNKHPMKGGGSFIWRSSNENLI